MNDRADPVPELDPDPDPDPAPSAGASGGRTRGVLAGVLGVLAIIVLLATTVAVWARATVLDAGKVGTIVGDALAEPEVEAALADYLTEQVFTLVDVDAALTGLLPGPLQRLEPVLAAGARSAVDRGLSRVLANEDVQAVIVQLVERAHARAMRLLEGGGLADGITIVDGEVTINTLPLLGRGVEQLQNLGLFGDLVLPELTASGDPDEQIAALSAATGRELPADFGQLVVYQSDRLADGQASVQQAQRVFSLAKRAVWVLVALTIVLVAATVLVARNRWRATFLLALGAVVAMVIARSVVHRVLEDAPELASRPGGRAAISSIAGGASEGLLRLAGAILIVAAIAAVVALFVRRWRRNDLVLAAAVLVGLAVIAVLGITIVSLVVGLALAVAVAVVGGRIFTSTPA